MGVFVERLGVEYSDDQILGYLVDEDDNELGVIVRDEHGNEVEVFFDQEDSGAEGVESADEDEVVELEIDEEDILYYFVDKQGREIGFCAKGEDGQKQDFFYPEEEAEQQAEPVVPEKKTGLPIVGDAVTKDDLKDMAGTFKNLAIDGYSAIADIMDQVDDVRDSLDAINPKKRRQARRAARRNDAVAEPASTGPVQVEPAAQSPSTAATD